MFWANNLVPHDLGGQSKLSSLPLLFAWSGRMTAWLSLPFLFQPHPWSRRMIWTIKTSVFVCTIQADNRLIKSSVFVWVFRADNLLVSVLTAALRSTSSFWVDLVKSVIKLLFWCIITTFVIHCIPTLMSIAAGVSFVAESSCCEREAYIYCSVALIWIVMLDFNQVKDLLNFVPYFMITKYVVKDVATIQLHICSHDLDNCLDGLHFRICCTVWLDRPILTSQLPFSYMINKCW